MSAPPTGRSQDHTASDQKRDPRFSGPAFFESIRGETERRAAVMCLLYDRRRRTPSTPTLAPRQLENLLNISSEDLEFTLWYLKQRGLVRNDDKSSLYLTVEGMDYLEQNLPAPDAVMALLKPA